MKLTKNARLSKKPFKANNGYAVYDPKTFDPNKQLTLNEQEFGITPSSVQTPTGIAPLKGQSPVRLEGAKTTPDLSGQNIDFNKSSSSSPLSPKSFDYSGLATTGMAMGVGAIEKQQASLEAVGKAPSLSGEMGKGALKGASYIAPVALNPAMLSATMGLSALAVPVAAGIGAGVNYVTGNKKIKEFNTQMDAKKSLARQALIDRTNQSSQYNQLDAVNRGYSTQGSNMSSFYKNGGVVYKQGGSLNPISLDTKLAVGRSHEDGGIKMSEDAEIEGGETVVDKGDHTLVVSDNLVNPITGRTFAKDDLRLAKLARKYEGATTQLAKNSLKHIQAKREALHGLQQQMNGDASDMDTAQNGGKLRPINILTKPVKTTPRPSTHLAKDGMKLYGNGGKTKKADSSDKNYDALKKGTFKVDDLQGGQAYWIDSKTGKLVREPLKGPNAGEPVVLNDDEAREVDNKYFKSKLYKNSTVPPAKIDPSKVDNTPAPSASLAGNPMTGNTIGKRVSDNSPVGGTMEGYNKTSNKVVQPSTLKGDSTGKNLRKVWDKTKEVGEAALPTLSRAGKLASYAAPALAQYYANKADIARQKGMKIPDAPQQGFQSLAKQNMEADRAAIRKQQADFNAGVAGTLADSQTAALLKANMASKAGDALVGVNQAERNANIETANKQTQLNLGIDAANKAAKYQQAGMQLEKDIDLSRRRAGNVAELSANIQQVQDVDRREKWADADTLVKVAGLDERGIQYLDRIGANPAGHYTGRKLLISRNGGKLTKLRK